MSAEIENRVVSVMSALIDAGLGAEARFVHRLWSELEENLPSPDYPRLSPHSILCHRCGWSEPAYEAVSDHSSFVKCSGCETVLLRVRHVEERIR